MNGEQSHKNWIMRHPILTIILAIVFYAIGSVALTDAKKKAHSNLSMPSTQQTAATTGSTSTNPTTTNATPVEEPTIKITAIALYNEFENNSVAAEEKYKTKRIEVTGTISSIETGLFQPYITLQSDNPYISSVYCYFDKSDLSTMVNLQKNQKVTLSGFASHGILAVDMKECQVIK